jgi:hypothetical protein
MTQAQSRNGAMRAADVIMHGKTFLDTDYGRKSQAGISDLIEKMTFAPELLALCVDLKNALSRMIDKHDPDSIEAEWIGHAHELITQATT